MRLDWIHIHNYKNLNDIAIDFQEKEPVTVVMGWNGTGKSNVLEFISIIFRDLITGTNKNKEKNKPSYDYDLVYHCFDSYVKINARAKRNKPYNISIAKSDNNTPAREIEKSHWKPLALTKLVQGNQDYLPKFVFGYYSGDSSRMEEVFKEYRKTLYSKQMHDKDYSIARLFYALPLHSQFVLLSFVLQQNNFTKDTISRYLDLDITESLDSVLFILRKPPWAKSKKQLNNDRFWGAKGLVRKFLDDLYDISLAPLRIMQSEDQESIWRKRTKKKRTSISLHQRPQDT